MARRRSFDFEEGKRGSLFSITSKSPWKSDSGAHDIVVGIRIRLQVNSDISDKLAM